MKILLVSEISNELILWMLCSTYTLYRNTWKLTSSNFFEVSLFRMNTYVTFYIKYWGALNIYTGNKYLKDAPHFTIFKVRMLSIAIWNHLICYSIQIAIWKLLILDWLELLMLEMMFKYILNTLLRGSRTWIYHLFKVARIRCTVGFLGFTRYKLFWK